MGIDAQAMADIQNELAAQAAENIVNNDNWEQWDNQADEMDEQQADNEDVIMEEVQQQEIAFDQSGSTAEYLRAHGPDITLNVEDVLAGNYSNSSSSSTDEVVSSMPSSQGSLPQFIQFLECHAFQKLANSSIPQQLHFPIVLDRATIPVNEDALGQRNETEVNNLAIIPLQPTFSMLLSLCHKLRIIRFPTLIIT